MKHFSRPAMTTIEFWWIIWLLAVGTATLSAGCFAAISWPLARTPYVTAAAGGSAILAAVVLVLVDMTDRGFAP